MRRVFFLFSKKVSLKCARFRLRIVRYSVRAEMRGGENGLTVITKLGGDLVVKVEKDIFSSVERLTALELLVEAYEIDATLPDLEFEIRKQLLSKEKLTGIYFLLNNDSKLLYIGKSTNVESRLISHIEGNGGNTKRFYKEISKIKIVFFNDMGVIELNALERIFIRSLRPAFNGSCDSLNNSTMKAYGYESLYFKLRDKCHFRNTDEVNNAFAKELLSEWEPVI